MGTHRHLDTTPASFPLNILEAVANDGSLLKPLVYSTCFAGMISLVQALL
jgi:hypothetical protein